MMHLILIVYFIFVANLLLKGTTSERIAGIRENGLLRSSFYLFAIYNYICAAAVIVSKFVLREDDRSIALFAHWTVAMVLFVLVWFVTERLGNGFSVKRRKSLLLVISIGICLACVADCLLVTVGGVQGVKSMMSSRSEVESSRLIISKLMPDGGAGNFIKRKLNQNPESSDIRNPYVLEDIDFVYAKLGVFHSMKGTYSLKTRTPVAVTLCGDLKYEDQQDLNCKVNDILRQVSTLLDCSFKRVDNVSLPFSLYGFGNKNILAMVKFSQNEEGEYNLHVNLYVELQSLSDGDSPAHAEG